MKYALAAALLLAGGAAYAQGVTAPAKPAAPGADTAVQPPKPAGPLVLTLRGLEKITGQATDITAPIGKPVRFATLTIVARSCYSTPASETPETSAFVQIDDHRPDQPRRRVFSGWMYASSPGLNAMDHPLYDVWAIGCNNNGLGNTLVTAGRGPVAVAAPDSSDREGIGALPEDAGR